MSCFAPPGAGGQSAPSPPPAASRDGGPRLSSIPSESAWRPWYEPLPASAISADVVWQQPVRRASHQGRRLNISMLLSLLFHALLLSLTFGGQEFGLPGFALPWQERRVEVPDLRIELAPTGGADPSPAIPAAPQPLSPVLTGQAAAGGPLVVTFSSPARPLLRRIEGSVPRKASKAKAHPKPKTKAVSGEAPTKASSAKPGQKQTATGMAD